MMASELIRQNLNQSHKGILQQTECQPIIANISVYIMYMCCEIYNNARF